MPMSAERISEKIVAALPAPAKGNELHYFSGATAGKKSTLRVCSARDQRRHKVVRLVPSCRRKPHLETLGRWDENSKGRRPDGPRRYRGGGQSRQGRS